jgi:hypothetical protein
MPVEVIEQIHELEKNMTLDLTEESGDVTEEPTVEGTAKLEIPLQPYTANDTNYNELNAVTNPNKERETTLDSPEECNDDISNQKINIEEHS